jgi:serine/threonine-protein kinase
MKEGTLLNARYQILERLGSGGMAEVFRARDLELDRYIAIKVLRADYSRSAEFQDRFRQEARAAANLSHPNIVTVHDVGMAEDQLFIIMEYVPGRDLKTLLRQHGRLQLQTAIPLMIQGCAGIGYAHRAGLVHCDVKPQNMLVTPDQRLKVTDFGIARALATMVPGEREKVVWGSPQYFSPEQARGEGPTPASDVYSLGVVLYELISGTPPFTASTAEELSRLHMYAEPLLISEYVPDISTELEQIVMKVLDKEPSRRYRTADQLGRVLLKFGTRPMQPGASAPSLGLTPEVGNQFQEGTSSQPVKTTAQTGASRTPVSEPNLDIDWISVILGLLALLAVGGLIPFWMWVYFSFRPPGG